MDIIIPYEEKIIKSGGVFIDPSGKFIFSRGDHIEFATDYCLGEEYDYLTMLKYDDELNPAAFEAYKIEHNYQGRREDIDVYSSSQLPKEQLELFKLYWVGGADVPSVRNVSDFLVIVLHHDKVESIIKKRITTANPNPHIRLFNYYINDWDIKVLDPARFNYNTNEFELDKTVRWIASEEDKEAEEEIKRIKSKVLLKDRPFYYR